MPAPKKKINLMQGEVEQLAQYAKVLTQSVLIMDERRHILQPLIQDDKLKASLGLKFQRSLGAQAYNHLAPLLAQDLVRDISRLFLDRDRKSASLVNTFRKASRPELTAFIRKRFSRIYDDLHKGGIIGNLDAETSKRLNTKWRAQDRAKLSREFDRSWRKLAADVRALEEDPVANKIKTFRDKFHAHLEMMPLGADSAGFDVNSIGLTYNDLFSFADRVMPPVFELNRLITGSVFDLPGFTEVHTDQAKSMWKLLSD